jgi:hypothetical protein
MARLVFKFVITPAAAVLRLLGADPMGLKPTQAQTYWKRRRKGVDMKSQF